MLFNSNGSFTGKVALLGRDCFRCWTLDGRRRWTNGAAIATNPIDP